MRLAKLALSMACTASALLLTACGGSNGDATIGGTVSGLANGLTLTPNAG